MEADEKLHVDFDEVTQMFVEIREDVNAVQTPDEFVNVVHQVTQKIFLKYFDFPNWKSYPEKELEYLMQHVMDCINSITPEHIPFTSVMIDRNWTLIPREAKKLSKPN